MPTWTQRYHCSCCRTALTECFDSVTVTKTDASNILLARAAVAGWYYERGWIAWCPNCWAHINAATENFEGVCHE